VADSAPLAGVRIADFSRVLAGPYCTMVLADLGADVVKVERPNEGDETRAWGPPFVGGEAAYYLSVNRNKRSAAIDLKNPDGRRLALELCSRADVVIENFRPGGAERLGLDAAAVCALNPRVVHCSITGFGRDDRRAGYDFIVQAQSGLMAVTGEPEGEPTKVGVALLDVLTGLHAATSILAALRRRDATGEGERIELSLLDSALASFVNVAQNSLVTDAEPRRYGNAHPSIVPYEPYRTADGWIAVAAANDGLFARLCTTLQRPELADDPRFATNELRVRNRRALGEILASIFQGRPVGEWVDQLTAAGVPAGKIRGVREALRADVTPLVVDHATAGRLELVPPPAQLASAPRRATRPPPLLGEHTSEVLAELGVSPSEADELERRGAIQRAAQK
jgi:crotonobetainyl-CoA:carnitine CoA-transferase CaiB-like acyl-CoA transferase